MADKYCQHGAYHLAAAATASQSGTTLTVTALSSGQISMGALITGAGYQAETRVSAFGTGTGGTGTYTVTKSQTVSPAVSITATEGLPHNTVPPVWGVPQEGDGVGIDPSTASAVTSLDLSGATAAAGNTFSVMGATLTCVSSGATGAQFNAGSGATLVSNLVAAINRTTNTASVAAQATGWVTHYLCNTVYARIGSPTTTLEIMTRAGSATYNGLTAAAWTGMTGMPSSPTWSGGVSGCWGYLANHWTIFQSQLAADVKYGLFGSLGVLAGCPITSGLGDFVYCRANRTINFSLSSVNLSIGPYAGTVKNPVVYVIDDGTKWPADGSTPILHLKHLLNGSASFGVTNNAAGVNVEWRGKKYADGTRNFKLSTPAGNQSNTSSWAAGSGLSYFGMEFDWSTNTTGSAMAAFNSSSTIPSRSVDCLFKVGFPDWRMLTLSSAVGCHEFIGCEWDGSALAAPVSGLAISVSSVNSPVEVIYEACRFSGFPVGSRLFIAGYNLSSIVQITYSNTDWGNLGGRGPLSVSGATNRKLGRYVSACSQFGNRDFFVDNSCGFVDWTSGQGFPTLSARLLDGTTPWSIRVTPTITAAAISQANPLDTPRIGKVNTLGTSALVVTCELLIEETLSWTKRDVSMLVVYQDSAGKVQSFDTYDFAGAALTASTATWSAEVSGQVPFYPGPVLYNKKKFSVQTPTAVLNGTEVGIFLKFYSAVADTTKGAFFDPELTLALP